MLRRLLDLPLLVLLLGMAGLAMLLPSAHAYLLRDYPLSRAFLYMALLVLIFAAMLGIARANSSSRNVVRNHLVSLAFAYVLLPPVLALPLIQKAAGGADLASATLEMLSAFTTTGARILDGPLEPTVELWRAFVGWLGGLFSVVMVFSVLAPLNMGGIEVETGRIPGRASPATQQISRIADPSERMARFASGIFPIYGGLTLVLWILLALAGEDSFVALCHAMGALSTSGISPLDGGMAAGQGGWIAEAFVGLFLLMALSRRPMVWLLGQARRPGLTDDAEIGLAFVILLGAVALLFAISAFSSLVWGAGFDLGAALRALGALVFTFLSFLTSTGYVSSGWEGLSAWSGFAPPDMMLWALAIIGGGVATAAGGVKLLRVHALLRYGEQELDRVIHPSAVARSRASGQSSRAAALQGTAMAWVFFMTFGLSIAGTVGLLTLLAMPFDEALVLALASLTITGPLVDQAGGIVASYSGQSGLVQLVLGFAMIVGRLETLAVLAILLPENLR